MFYGRYIDQFILMFSEAIFEPFNRWINSVCPHLTTEGTLSPHCLPSFDLEILLGELRIKVRLYKKSTDRSSLLHYRSNHPKHLRDSLPLGLFVRLKCHSSDPQDFKAHSTILSASLLR